MKKNLLLLVVAVIGLLSCEDDISYGAPLHSNPPILELESQKIHPSILKSSWWNSFSTSAQNFLATELMASQQQITYKELTEMRINASNNRNVSNLRSPGIDCSGYPIANPEGDVILLSQADVAAFGATDCNHIIGSLLIDDTGSPDPITDLYPLNNIMTVGSSMTIISSRLKSLKGLSSLTSVGYLGPFGYIAILGAELKSIKQLSSLSTITGSLNVRHCPKIKTIKHAFSGIISIESGLTPNPIFSGYVFDLDNNDKLKNIKAFSSLSVIEGHFQVWENNTLEDLDDLSALTSIGGQIQITDNNALLNVDALSDITSIGGGLIVTDNTSLNDCCGLYQLLCSDQPICSTTGVGGNILISGNGVDCTVAGILAGGPCM